MNHDERVLLLDGMSALAHEEAENVDKPEKSFLPLASHQLALRREIIVVRGGRGAGKSALFKLLTTLDSDVRTFFDDTRQPAAQWIDAFSGVGMAHPSVVTLDSLATTTSDSGLRAFWLAHLLTCASAALNHVRLPPGFREKVIDKANVPETWVAWAESNVSAIAASLDDIERDRGSKMVFATYDQLDRIGQHDRGRTIRGRYVATLLSMWLSLSNRYRSLRAKIFLRDDLFDAAERAFPDAGKLRPRSVSLEWTVEDLYRAAVRQLTAPAGSGGSDMVRWLRGIPKLQLTAGNFGLMPGPMPEVVQKAFAKELAGEFMGAGAKKGFTHRWIPNHLQDAKKRIVPRSMLNLLGVAAAHARQAPLGKGRRVLDPEDLSGALDEVSKRRAKEVAQEYPLVDRLNNLAGQTVMLPRDLVVAKLAAPRPGEDADISRDGELVLAELVDLGVLRIRDDGRIDVPDIYRHGFKIKRKGGVARPR